MKRVHNMTYDGIGYVNGRGKSKYWGVTTGIDGNGKDFWIVSFTPVERTETFTMHSENFKLGELDAAKIAAYIVENGRSMNLQDAKILSHDKRYVLSVKNTTIYRSRYVSQAVYKNKTEVNLFDVVLPEKPATGTPEVLTMLRQFPTQLPETKKVEPVVEIVDTESSEVAALMQMILDCNLSSRASRALIAVIQSTIV